MSFVTQTDWLDMLLVNFYSELPSAEQVASDLSDHDLVVFKPPLTGAAPFEKTVQALVDFGIDAKHESTDSPWGGDDYFVVVREDFEFLTHRGRIRALAADWFAAECTNQARPL